MSNPAVIMLTNTNTKSGGRFKVEDNIGESMHIHYDNFRIDLTIKEFLLFTEIIEKSMLNLIDNKSFNINNFDPIFLHDISHMLKDLVTVKYDKIKLSSIIVSTNGLFGVPKWSRLKESRVFKAMSGDFSENNNYKQSNLINQTNQERVDNVKSIIEQKGYPFNDEYLVFFNNQNYIRDGQHRACSLLFDKGDLEVPVLRLFFKDDKYNLNDKLWLTSFFPIMKSNLRNIARKILNRIRNYNKF